MAQLIVMPKLSDTMEEGAIANWLKKEGDAIDEGQDLVEIETDKATMTFASAAEGVVLKILLEPRKTVPLSAPMCVIGKKGESFNLDELIAKSTAGAKPADKKHAPGPQAKAPVAAAIATTPSAATSAASSSASSAALATSGRVKASPLAKKIAADKGINLAAVMGSGPAGRVVVKDLESMSAGAAVSMRSVRTGEDRVIPNSMMRKTIAKRLLAGKNEAPHFYLTVSADMTRMNDWRGRLNKDADKSGVKVSVNDLVIMAVAKALVKHPDINASWQGDSIIEFGNVHVSMAVALPTGLVTPVIRHTDQLSIRDIAKSSRELAVRAKDGKLTNDDYAGGTFTISNLGMFGIEEFTAIINPPQAAILAVGATIPTPAVDAKGQVVAQPRMKMTMSCDHRVIDGAMGAQFLQTLVSYLEDPLNML
jgi:pyruvate dehydrogenase E2 component (dihydrolipoamide acetyltransferase)